MFPKDISPSSVSRKVVALRNVTWKCWLGLQTRGSKVVAPAEVVGHNSERRRRTDPNLPHPA